MTIKFILSALVLLLLCLITSTLVNGQPGFKPVVESLDNVSMDDVLQGEGLNSDQGFTWGIDSDFGRDIATDYNGNVYTVGDTHNIVNGTQFRDIVLVKWDESGNQLWDRTWPGSGDADGYSYEGIGVDVDIDGNVYTFGVCDRYVGSWSSLVKWNSSGQEIWNRTLELFRCIEAAVDHNKNIYTVGYNEDWTFSLIKWDPNGNQLWNHTRDDLGVHLGYGVTVDNNGCIYTLGSKGSTSSYAFLVKWDTNGNQMWNRTWKEVNYGYGVATDSYRNIYTIGESRLPDFMESNVVLVKWNSEGEQLWIQTLNHTLYVYKARDVAVGGDGSVYVVGSIPRSSNSQTKKFPGNYDLLVVKWNETGGLIGAKTWGVTSGSTNFSHADWGSGITIGRNDKIYCVGTTHWPNGNYKLLMVIFSPDNFTMAVFPSIIPTSVPGIDLLLLILTISLLAFLTKKRKKIRRKNMLNVKD
ncbi:MAG: SBBP repeat-containing protein [Candidatus Hermodarchaeota archaeon]